jgi:hypothetical protein
MAAVHRHTGGHGHDDIALLLLEYGAHPPSSATGHPRPGRETTLAAQQRLAAVTRRPPRRTTAPHPTAARHADPYCRSLPSRLPSLHPTGPEDPEPITPRDCLGIDRLTT